MNVSDTWDSDPDLRTQSSILIHANSHPAAQSYKKTTKSQDVAKDQTNNQSVATQSW